MIYDKDSFKKKIDDELNNIRFSESSRAEVLGNLNRPGKRILGFLNREIEIPLKPLAVAVLIVVCSFTYLLFTNVKVSAEDIRKSEIVIISNVDGGR